MEETYLHLDSPYLVYDESTLINESYPSGPTKYVRLIQNDKISTGPFAFNPCPTDDTIALFEHLEAALKHYDKPEALKTAHFYTDYMCHMVGIVILADELVPRELVLAALDELEAAVVPRMAKEHRELILDILDDYPDEYDNEYFTVTVKEPNKNP